VKNDILSKVPGYPASALLLPHSLDSTAALQSHNFETSNPAMPPTQDELTADQTTAQIQCSSAFAVTTVQLTENKAQRNINRLPRTRSTTKKPNRIASTSSGCSSVQESLSEPSNRKRKDLPDFYEVEEILAHRQDEEVGFLCS
jgi:hypothetical protein